MAVLSKNDMFFTTFQPKQKNSYVMYIEGIPSFMINKVDPPKFQDKVQKINHINTYFNIRGKRTWQDATIVLYDPITPSGAQAVMDWARLGYESVTGRAGYADWYKKDIVLDVLGPVGDVVSEWTYKGAFVNDMSSDQYDWGSEGDPVNISLKISYDYAVLNY